MRYQKGSFELSRAQDLPLLRQVLRSQFVTYEQMFEFMKLGCHEIRRQSFNWRIKRLVDTKWWCSITLRQLQTRIFIPSEPLGFSIPAGNR